MTPRFNTRKPDGSVCCLGDFGCPSCKGAETAALRGQTETYAPPNPWALTAAQQRERTATPELRAEAAYKARRTRAFEAEYAKADAFYGARPALRALSAEELNKYAPPNSYPSLKRAR